MLQKDNIIKCYILSKGSLSLLIRFHVFSGARRFVTLDFGGPVALTDVVIPSSSDLASLSIDVWVEGEEHDGQRLVVAQDIGNE